jgi:Fur family ferric uptake transcriptional regulator
MTVYRTLDLLCELGLLRPIYQGTGAAHYILMSGGSHHHLVCIRCHQAIEFDDCLAGELAHELGQRLEFQVSGHLLELYGLCLSCQEQTA